MVRVSLLSGLVGVSGVVVPGCAGPPVLPFPSAQCAFLESLDTSGCGSDEGDCIEVVCINADGPTSGCPGTLSVGVGQVDEEAIQSFIAACESRGRCVNAYELGEWSCATSPGFWSDGEFVLGCYEPPCGYPKW